VVSGQRTKDENQRRDLKGGKKSACIEEEGELSGEIKVRNDQSLGLGGMISGKDRNSHRISEYYIGRARINLPYSNEETPRRKNNFTLKEELCRSHVQKIRGYSEKRTAQRKQLFADGEKIRGQVVAVRYTDSQHGVNNPQTHHHQSPIYGARRKNLIIRT